jgi:copper chaperone
MRIVVEGMSCEHCVRAITDAVTKVTGYASVTVSLDDGTVEVEGVDDREAVIAAIRAEGYEVRMP